MTQPTSIHTDGEAAWPRLRVQPAEIELTAEGPPFSPQYGDIYHARAGAWAQAHHVFLSGNDLPNRWAHQAEFVILETGFGLGHNFLRTWAAWEQDPHRCQRLYFLSVEKHPLTREDLQRALAQSTASHQAPTLVQALLAAWPPLTPGIHVLPFADGQIELHLAWGDVQWQLPRWIAQVNAFYLDGFSPARNADMWSAKLLKQLGRLAAKEATLATWSAARCVREALCAAGFRVTRCPGFAHKRDMIRADYAPYFRPSPPPGGLRTPQGPRQALIIGGGLAGCATARTLGQLGWDCTVLDRNPACAQGASGHTAGLFHGTMQAEDSLYSRWHRYCALHMARWAKPRVASGQLAGRIDGLLRLDSKLDSDLAQQRLWRAGLPPSYVEWLSQDTVHQRWGLHPPAGGWYFPDAGWLSPAQVCDLWLRESHAQWHGHVDVMAIHHQDTAWTVTAHDGRQWMAPVVIVACATHTPTLMPPILPSPWLTPVRGQTTTIPAPLARTWGPPLNIPLADAGYALSLPDGSILCGATSQANDLDARVRTADHIHNLTQWSRLTGQALPAAASLNTQALTGRCAWRAVTRDKLPVIGPWPHPHPLGRSSPQPTPQRQRWTSAHGGLYVLTGLASRGLCTALLSSEILASWISGTPCPVEKDLRDALDPARLDRPRPASHGRTQGR